MNANKPGSLPLDDTRTGREAERDRLLRALVATVASELILALPHAQRTASESQALYDCAGGRRSVGKETLWLLLTLQARCEGTARHALSDALRSRECALVASEPDVCRFDVSLEEGAANASLNAAQELAVHEDTPTRWTQVWELCREQVRQTIRLMDAAARRMHVTSPRAAR